LKKEVSGTMVPSTETESQRCISPSGWEIANDVSRGVKTRRREGKPIDVRKRK